MKTKQLIAALSMSILAGGASAAVVTMNATANLTLAEITASSIRAGNYFNQADALGLVAPVTVATGDTFVYNLDFLGNQQLTVLNMNMAWPLVITQNGGQSAGINMTGTLELLAADNSVVASATKSNGDGSIHIAQVFSGVDFGSPAALTFAGFRYTGVVDSQDVNPRTYDAPTMWFDGSSVELGEFVSNDVPEPGSFALMMLGLGIAGAMLKRRR
jgi:hypothetical protein